MDEHESGLLRLGDEAWTAIEPHLPRGRPGAPRIDDRLVISGVLYVLKAGCRGLNCPRAAYGPRATIYNRFKSQSLESVAKVDNWKCLMPLFWRDPIGADGGARTH